MKDIMEVKKDLETKLEVVQEIIDGDGQDGTSSSRSTTASNRVRRHMAPETRAKIAAAARARWARVRGKEKSTSRK